MALDREGNRDRIKAGIGVAAFHALLGYALIMGLGIDVAKVVDDKLKVFDVPPEQPPPPPPKPPEPIKPKAKEPEGAAAPPSLKARPTPIVAPPPKVRLKVPPPVAAVPKPSPLPPGAQNSAGVSNIAGTGTGTGGVGDGTGSGGPGNGTGSGGGGTKPLRVRGALSDKDYWLVARRPRHLPQGTVYVPPTGTVAVLYSVETDGRVTGCTVRRSSGHPELDAMTCRLIERRFRYRPATDVTGRSVRDVVTTNFYWGPTL